MTTRRSALRTIINRVALGLGAVMLARAGKPTPLTFELTPEETNDLTASWQTLTEAQFAYRRSVAAVKIAHDISPDDPIQFDSVFGEFRLVTRDDVVSL